MVLGSDVEPQFTSGCIDGVDLAQIFQPDQTKAKHKGNLAAHSLRAGFISAAAEINVPEIDIVRVSADVAIEVLRGYVRRAKALDAPPLAAILK